jgi:hypothetical protein
MVVPRARGSAQAEEPGRGDVSIAAQKRASLGGDVRCSGSTCRRLAPSTDAERAGLHRSVGTGDHPRDPFTAGRLARPPRSFFLGELSAGLIFAGGVGLLGRPLGRAYLVAAGVVLGVLSAMLAIWILFVGLALEQREG